MCRPIQLKRPAGSRSQRARICRPRPSGTPLPGAAARKLVGQVERVERLGRLTWLNGLNDLNYLPCKERQPWESAVELFMHTIKFLDSVTGIEITYLREVPEQVVFNHKVHANQEFSELSIICSKISNSIGWKLQNIDCTNETPTVYITKN